MQQSAEARLFDHVPAEIKTTVSQSPGVVIPIAEHEIARRLAATVHVRGRANVQLRQLFCPLSQAVLVIRRRDGSLHDPFNLNSDLGAHARRGAQAGRRSRRRP